MVSPVFIINSSSRLVHSGSGSVLRSGMHPPGMIQVVCPIAVIVAVPRRRFLHRR